MEYAFFLVAVGTILWLARRAYVDRQAAERLAERVSRLEFQMERHLRDTERPRETVPIAAPVTTATPTIAPLGPPVSAVGEARLPSIPAESLHLPPPLPFQPATPATATPPLDFRTPTLVPPVPERRIPLPAFNWEQFVGVKLFAWLGGLALFFAAALGLKYSFDHDLVPAEIRAAGGFLLGAGLVAGGVFLRQRRYEVTSQTLIASGVVILYAVTFACRAFYHFPFFGPIPTFLLMVLITATAFLLAVRLDGPVIAILGMLGGFLTPVLLSTGQDNPLGLFGYVALLDLGLIAVAQRKRWDYLMLLAAVGTLVMQIGWVGKFFVPEKIFVAQGVFLGFPGLFLATFVWADRRNWMNAFVTAATALLSVAALAMSFQFVLGNILSAFPGRTFPIAFGADLVLLAMVTLQPRRRFLESIGSVALFILLALWTLTRLQGPLIYWALGLYLLFAVLHTVYPVVLRVLRPEAEPPRGAWNQFIPAVALLLALLPIALELTVPWLFWIVVLAVDALAVALALVTGTLLGLLAVIVLTFLATAVWLAHSTAQAVDLSESIVVIGGFAVFFFAAGAFLWRRGPGLAEGPGSLAQRLGPWPTPQLPFDPRPVVLALSAGLPFLLLVMVIAQFKPANPSSVFGLAALLVTLLLGLARFARLGAPAAAALGGAWLVQAAWQATSLDPGRAALPLAWTLGFYAVLSVFPFVFRRDFAERHLPWAVAALAGPAHFLLVYQLVKQAYPNPVMGLLPAAFALPALAAVTFLLRTLSESPQRVTRLAWFGGVALCFITLIFPIQFDKQWITVAWALEGAALCWLFQRVPHPGLRYTGVALLLVAFARLALNPAVLDYHPRTSMPILNWYLYAFGVTAAALFAGAKLLAPPRNRVLGQNIPAWLQALATVLLFLLVNVEIADYFATGSTLTFEFRGSFGRDMAYTIAWALFAFVLLVVGIRRRARFVRYAALGLLGVALIKLFLHDLAQLGQLYRIGAFAAVAVIAIIASFLYQRFLTADTPPTVEPKLP